MFVHSRTLTMVCTDERAAPPPPPWRPSPQNATWATNPRIAAKPPSLLALHRRSMLWCRRPLSFIGQHEDHGIRPVDHALEVGPRTTRALFESSHYSLLATSRGRWRQLWRRRRHSSCHLSWWWFHSNRLLPKIGWLLRVLKKKWLRNPRFLVVIGVSAWSEKKAFPFILSRWLTLLLMRMRKRLCLLLLAGKLIVCPPLVRVNPARKWLLFSSSAAWQLVFLLLPHSIPFES